MVVGMFYGNLFYDTVNGQFTTPTTITMLAIITLTTILIGIKRNNEQRRETHCEGEIEHE